MLKVRIIPTLLMKDVGLVKGVGFDSWRRVGSVLPAIKVYNTRDVDELILLDISATREGRRPDFENILEAARQCFVPLAVGGGVRTVEDIRGLLRAGADKIVINTEAYRGLDLITQGARSFGAQCIVVSIDARCVGPGQHECFSHSGSKGTGKDPAQWAQEVEAAGAGELLITSVERDGTMQGYDLHLVRQVAESVSIPVIASGGAGSYEHMFEALDHCKASAVAAASIYHFTQQTPAEAKAFLRNLNIPVRNSGTRERGIEG